MKTITFLKQTILCMALGFMTLALNAQIITIDNNPGSTTTYQTIQDALNNVPSGATIYVQPSGTSYGAANIFFPVTIVGRSHSEPTKISQLGAVSIRTSGVTIKGIRFNSLSYSTQGAPSAPPYVGTKIYECRFTSAIYGTSAATTTADDIEVRGCVMTSTQTIYADTTNLLFSNNIFLGAINAYNTLTLVVGNNIFRTINGATLTNNSASGTFNLFNNMFTANNGSNITIKLNNGPFNLTNCLTYNYGFGNLTFTTNASGSFIDVNTLLNTNPLFTDVDNTVAQSFAGTTTYNSAFRPEDDLTLQDPASPALTGGIGGSEIGLFNSGFNFEKLGNPRGLPSLDITNYDGAVPKDGNINVTISAKSY